jgi:hypothetical protein
LPFPETVFTTSAIWKIYRQTHELVPKFSPEFHQQQKILLRVQFLTMSYATLLPLMLLEGIAPVFILTFLLLGTSVLVDC